MGEIGAVGEGGGIVPAVNVVQIMSLINIPETVTTIRCYHELTLLIKKVINFLLSVKNRYVT